MKDQIRIELFSKVKVSFSKNGDEFDTMQDYEQKEISSPSSSSINRNVTIELCGHVGKYLMFNFTFNSGKFSGWMTQPQVTSEC